MKDIPNYQKLYAVTEEGQVWSYRKNDFLIPTLNEQGYYKVTLFDNDGEKKCIYIHKLVALTYIPIPQSEEELTVDHIDRNKRNNTVSNLRWVTRSVQNQNKNWTEKMQSSVEKAAKEVRSAAVEFLKKVTDKLENGSKAEKKSAKETK